MPAITPGRSSTSQTGRVGGRRSQKTKAKTRQRQRTVISTAKAIKRTQAAHAKEAQRKKTLARTAPGRQLGEGTRGRYEPKTDLRSTRIGTGGRYHPTDKESTALKAVVASGKAFNKGLLGILAQAGGENVKTGSGPSTRLAASVPKPGKLFGRTAKDVYQFPAQTVVSAAAMAQAGNALRKGDSGPAKKILKDLDEHDPVWNSALAFTNAVTGNKKGAKVRYDQAVKSIEEHPGLAAIEVFGLKGTTGRAVTRGASGTARVAQGVERVAPGRAKAAPRRVKERARKIASTERAEARLPGTNLVEHRKYSRDAFTRLQQRKRDKYRSDRARRLRGDATSARMRNEHERARELFEQANVKDPEVISGRGIRRAIDEHVDATERIRRRNRAIAEKETSKALKGAKRGGPITSLLTQRITKADLPSLRAYRDKIRDEGSKLDRRDAAKIEANGILVRELSEAIKNVEKGKVDLANLQRISDVYAARSEISQAEMVRLGMVTPDQAQRRAASPFAVSELGARKEPETLKAAAVAAKAEADRQKAKLASAKGARREVVGAQRSKRANEPTAKAKRKIAREAPNRVAAVQEWIRHVENMDPKELAKAIKREEKLQRQMTRADARIERRKAATKTAKRKASAAKKRAEENPLVLPGGVPLSTAQMLSELERVHGAGTKAAYVSQKPGQTKASAHFVPADEAPSANTGAYGGGATRQGTFDASPERLVEQQVRTQGVVDAFKGFQRMIDRFGLRDKDGKPVQRDTYKLADQEARDRSTEGQEWVAIRMNPIGAKQGQLQAMIEGTSDQPMAQVLRDAARAPDKGDESGPWTVVPKDVADQMAKHMDKLNPGNAQRLAQQGTSAFRRTVLSTSPTWFAGNIGEGAFRSAVHGVGPRSWLTGRRALKETRKTEGLTPEQRRAREEAALVGEARTIGTGEASLTQMRQLHRDLSQYHDGSIKTMARIGKAILDARVKGTPISPRLIVSLWDGYTNLTMNLVNKGIENQFQTAMLGKAIRKQRTGSGKRQIAHRPKILMTQRARDLSNQAAKEAAEGILNENTASALGKEIDRMYGRYSKMSPDVKTAILYYTPFAAWMMNALKFLGRMPEDNPTFTLATSIAERASEEWRKERGLDMQGIFGTPKEGESVPQWLQGSIPDSKGGHYRAPTRYTPMSVGVDLPSTIAGQALPQVMSTLAALQGRDWKGQQLRDENGDPIDGPERFVAAADAMMRGIVPGYGLIQRSRDKGLSKVIGKEALLGYIAPQEGDGGGSGGSSRPSDDWEQVDDFEETDDWESGGWESEDW